MYPINNRVMPDHAVAFHDTVEQHAIKANKDVIAHNTGAMHNGSMGYRRVLPYQHGCTGLRMDDDAVLNVGIGAGVYQILCKRVFV